MLSEKLVEEIEGLDLNSSDGFFASFKYCIKGAPLRSTLLPARQVLFRKKHGKYIQDGHAHKLVNSGTVNSLKHFIYHDDRKPFSRWWNAQIKYSHQEANKLVNSAFGELNAQDKLRSFLLVAPIAVFFYCLFWKGLILDGWNGIVYASQRFMAEFLLSVFLLKRYLSSPSKISSE